MDADNEYSTNRLMQNAICMSFLDGLGLSSDAAAGVCARWGHSSLRAELLIPRLLQLAAEAGAQPHACIYVSTPITTGRHHLNAHRNGSTVTSGHRANLIGANRRRGQAIVRRLRAAHVELVIDPTGLDDVPDWVQDDYHRLWIAVIRRFARTVVFVDDWQYSVGCAKEFAAAVELELPLLDQHLKPFDYSHGLYLLRDASQEVSDVFGLDSPLLRAVADVEALVKKRFPMSGDDQ